MGWGGKRSGAGGKTRESTIARRLVSFSLKAIAQLSLIPHRKRSTWLSRLVELNAPGWPAQRIGDLVQRHHRSGRIVFVAPLDDRWQAVIWWDDGQLEITKLDD